MAGLFITIMLAAFSLFLLSIDQSYLPSSVLVKSAVVESGLSKLIVNLEKNFVYPQAWIMLAGVFILLPGLGFLGYRCYLCWFLFQL